MNDEKTAADYKVSGGSVLHLVLGLWEQTNNLSGLSPPSESRLMQRRKSVHNSNSLQLNRISSAGSKVTSIQDLIRPVPIASPSC